MGLIRFAVVGAKSYFAKHTPPKEPQELVAHSCINLRLPTYGGLYAWEFENDGREVKVRVEGQLVFNSIFENLNAALGGFGLAHVPDDLAQPYLAKGLLVRVLDEWCPPWPGYHLYYPSRRQSSPAFALFVSRCVTGLKVTRATFDLISSSSRRGRVPCGIAGIDLGEALSDGEP